MGHTHWNGPHGPIDPSVNGHGGTVRPDPAARPPGPIGLTRYPEELSYVGIQSFMKLPVCMTPADLQAAGADVAICGVPWEATYSRSGTGLGPRSIRMADYMPTPPYEKPHLDVRVDPLRVLSVVDYGDCMVYPGYIDKTFAEAQRFIREIAETGAIPIILGGDHGITQPDVMGLADVYGYGKIGVVHFDAHADTAPEMMGCMHGHGQPMRRLIESGAVKGKNFVQVGLRGYWPGPDIVDWMDEQEMKTHFMAEVHKHGFDRVVDRAVNEALEGSPDHLFISLDVDVVDPSAAPGTGSPEPGGLSAHDILRIVRRLAAEVGIVGMDVVEVSPPYDAGNSITALLAHRTVMEALTGTAMRRLGITQPDYLHPVAAGDLTEAEMRAQTAAP
jgi:agmatinase